MKFNSIIMYTYKLLYFPTLQSYSFFLWIDFEVSKHRSVKVHFTILWIAHIPMIVCHFICFYLLISGVMRYEVGATTIVRFANSKSGGLLEMLKNSRWFPFCTSGFNFKAANLSCHELGYLYVANYGSVIELGYANFK